MPEVTIKYKKPETLKILKGLAKYFDFTIAVSKSKANNKLNDILVPGDPSIDITDLKRIVTANNLDAKQLRKDTWERKK